MSTREKRLLIFFALAGFLIVNILGFRMFIDARTKAAAALKAAETDRKGKIALAEERASLAEDIQWLADHEPRPASPLTVQAGLQELVSQQAATLGLVTKQGSVRFLPVEENTNTYYSRARVEIAFTGTEQNLYKWFGQINDPEKLRAVTFIHLAPNKEEDFKIDCKATVEQWFLPATTES